MFLEHVQLAFLFHAFIQYLFNVLSMYIQCIFNVYSINIQLLQYVDIKCVLHHALQYFNVYSMCIQYLFNVLSMYSMCIQCVFSVYSIYIQCLVMYSLFALAVTPLLTDSHTPNLDMLSYLKSLL